jgi:hypothetical protein
MIWQQLVGELTVIVRDPYFSLLSKRRDVAHGVDVAAGRRVFLEAVHDG